MPSMEVLSKDSPIMIAWEKYKATEEFKNSSNWAKHREPNGEHLHVEGALWAAFYQGFVFGGNLLEERTPAKPE
jgi:hypothetical protein